MADRLNHNRDRRNDGVWLGTLVETMERVARPEVARRPCDRRVIDALKAKLEQPAKRSQLSDMMADV